MLSETKTGTVSYRNGFSVITLDFIEAVKSMSISDIEMDEGKIFFVTNIEDKDAFKKLNFKGDGVLGLASRDDDNDYLMPLHRYWNKHPPENQQFSFYLKPKTKKDLNQIPNIFTFGGFDKQLIEPTKEMFYCPKTLHNIWAVQLDSISLEYGKTDKTIILNNTDLIMSINKDKDSTRNLPSASISSETNPIILQEKHRKILLDYLNKAGRNCKNQMEWDLIICQDMDIAHYPDIVFNLCGSKTVLNPIDYIDVKDEYVYGLP